MRRFVYLFLVGCQPALSTQAIEAIRVFAPLRQPWAVDVRGVDMADACVRPFAFDLDMGAQISEAVYISMLLVAGAVDAKEIDAPGLTAVTLDAMRQAEQDTWQTILGTSGTRHEPRTPAPGKANDPPTHYSLGRGCILGDLMGFDHAVLLAPECKKPGVTYRWTDGNDHFRVERPDRLATYDSNDRIFVVRSATLLMLAQRCEGFGCVMIDWVDLGPVPFIEHMIFDERGGSGERRTFVNGASRVQQRTYRRNADGLACELDMLERDEHAGLLRPWNDTTTALQAPYASDVFDKGYSIGVPLSLASAEPPEGALEVVAFTAHAGAYGFDTLVAAGFLATINGTPTSFALARPALDTKALTVFRTDGTATRWHF